MSGKAAKRLIAEGGQRRLLHAPPPVSPSANPKLPELEALTEERVWAWATEKATEEAEFGKPLCRERKRAGPRKGGDVGKHARARARSLARARLPSLALRLAPGLR